MKITVYKDKLKISSSLRTEPIFTTFSRSPLGPSSIRSAEWWMILTAFYLTRETV